MRRFVRRTLLGGLAALGALVILATLTPLVSWYAGKLASPWEDRPGDLLIVLAGDSMEWQSDRILGLGSYWRCVGALYAFRDGHFRQILISGGATASRMRDFMVFEGIPPEAVRVETASQTTRESALAVARLLAREPGTKVLLTSDYHMWRARRAFARAGLPVGAWPVPDARKGGWRHRWPGLLDEAAETAKIAYYFCRAWI